MLKCFRKAKGKPPFLLGDQVDAMIMEVMATMWADKPKNCNWVLFHVCFQWQGEKLVKERNNLLLVFGQFFLSDDCDYIFYCAE